MSAVLLLLSLFACSTSETAPTESAPGFGRTGPASNVWLIARKFGRLKVGTKATAEAVASRFPNRTITAFDEPNARGAVLQVDDGERALLEVIPHPAGEVDQVWSMSTRVIGPGRFRLGTEIGMHPKWSKMSCRRAAEPFDDFVSCSVGTEDPVIQWMLEVDGEVPSKDGLAQEPTRGVLWSPR